MPNLRALEKVPVVFAVLLLGGCATLDSAPETPRTKAAEINLQLGAGYMRSGHYDVALQKLNKALRYDNSLPQAHNAIAVLYEEIREYEAAESHYRQAVELEPDYTLARLNYARFLCAHGKPEAGEQQYLLVAAEETVPNAAELGYVGASTCARRQGQLEQAEAHLRQALEVDPGNPRVLYELANLSLTRNEPLQARAFLQRYHEVAGYNPASLWLGITIEEALGDIGARREYARLLLVRFADSEEARRLQSE